MKLKEAQMLGILALIAVGIVLLCMWGGGDDLVEETVVESDGAPTIEPRLAPVARDLLKELREKRTEVPAAQPVEETDISIGAVRVVDATPSEDAQISDLIEQHEPKDIPLTPRRKPSAVQVVQPGPAVTPQPIIHTVLKGETLGEISQKYYGTCKRWGEIQAANDNLDPRLLREGMKLKIPVLAGASPTALAAASGPQPALNATTEAPSAPVRTYTVKKGDSLFRIALKFYDDGTRWPDIQRANKGTIPDPTTVRPGMELVIP